MREYFQNFRNRIWFWAETQVKCTFTDPGISGIVNFGLRQIDQKIYFTVQSVIHSILPALQSNKWSEKDKWVWHCVLDVFQVSILSSKDRWGKIVEGSEEQRSRPAAQMPTVWSLLFTGTHMKNHMLHSALSSIKHESKVQFVVSWKTATSYKWFKNSWTKARSVCPIDLEASLLSGDLHSFLTKANKIHGSFLCK